MVHKLLMSKAAGGFVPTDIAGLHAWFKADSISASDGDTVTTWSDSSGNGRDAGGGVSPKYRTSIVGGKPVVSFSEVATDARLVTSSWTAITQGNTIFVVAKTGSHAAFAQVYDGIVSTDRHALFRSNTSATEIEAFAGASITAITGGMVTAYAINCTLFSTTSSESWTGGGSGTTGNAGAHSLTGLTLSNRYASGFQSGEGIAELLLYDSALSLADINDVGDYLAAKYGLTWSTAT